jgi:3-deoxy-manno-octulosonate cytidylyltransferase (CMP-KDO synthetase)
MKTIAIIPARYGSTRFPGKPLAPIAGIPMILRVWDQASKCKFIQDLIVATDDERIAEVVVRHQGKVVMTSPHHPTGTDRLIEVKQQVPNFDIYLNIQGDEPLLNPEVPDALIKKLTGNTLAEIATPVCAISDPEKLVSPHVVKVVKDQQGYALYFSRHPIPYLREISDPRLWVQHHQYLQHVGVYAFKAQALDQIASLPMGILEKAESLEQLRWIEAGIRILTCFSEAPGPAIDTPEDLQNIESLYF